VKLSKDLLFQCVWLAPLALISSLVGAKPLPPIQVGIEAVNQVQSGQPVEFIVRATVNTDVDNLQITVIVPPTVKITSGEWHWRGQLLKGEEKQLRFTAISDGAANRAIEARASIIVENGTSNGDQNSASQAGNVSQLAASATYVWESGSARATATATQALPLGPLDTPRVVERDGRKIAEYKIKP
jgi:hypothetical protein